MLNKEITNVFHVENISLNQLVWWFIIHQGQNHKCDYCGKFYTQMTNLKIHLWLLCPWWIILIWIIRLMKNLYTHFQIACSSKIFATLITIESFLSWTAVICPFNPILCVKFLPHSSHLYFLKSFMDIFHMYFKISLSNNFFFFGNFYSQMTNLKIHYKIVHEGQKKF